MVEAAEEEEEEEEEEEGRRVTVTCTDLSTLGVGEPNSSVYIKPFFCYKMTRMFDTLLATGEIVASQRARVASFSFQHSSCSDPASSSGSGKPVAAVLCRLTYALGRVQHLNANVQAVVRSK